MDKITIIVPCYNEAEVVPHFYDAVETATADIPDAAFTYLFIDDGSRDATLTAIRALAEAHTNVRYISFTRNFGKEPAMMAGLDYADGDAVILMDADLQHPPSLIPEMIAHWRAGYDDVCGRRTDRADETWFKRTMANLFYRSMQSVSRFTLQRDVGDFRLLDHRCVAHCVCCARISGLQRGSSHGSASRRRRSRFRCSHVRRAGRRGAIPRCSRLPLRASPRLQRHRCV